MARVDSGSAFNKNLHDTHSGEGSRAINESASTAPPRGVLAGGSHPTTSGENRPPSPRGSRPTSPGGAIGGGGPLTSPGGDGGGRSHPTTSGGPPGTASQKMSAINDIGEAVGNSCLSNEDRVRLLERWKAPDGFVWPYTERKAGQGTRKRHLRPQHFQGKYECFSYLPSKEGVFCKTCVLFGVLDAGGVPLNRLVRTPLKKI